MTHPPFLGRSVTLHAIAVCLVAALTSASIFAAPVNFADDFNRPDGTIGNGWVPTPSDVGGFLTIVGNHAVGIGADGQVGIMRNIGFGGNVSVRASIAGPSFVGAPERGLDTYLSFLGNGSLNSGVSVRFHYPGVNFGIESRTTIETRVNGNIISSVFAPRTSSAQVQLSLNPVTGVISGAMLDPTGTSVINPISSQYDPSLITNPTNTFAIGTRLADSASNPLILPAIDDVSLTFEPSLVPLAILDPVPSLLRGSGITTDYEVLAIGGSRHRPVSGVAADGVAQVVLKIPARFDGQQFSVAIDGSTDTVENGGVGAIETTDEDPVISIQAVNTAAGPLAFARYRAPVDFVRISAPDDANAVSRTVSIRVTSSDDPDFVQILPIKVIRPLVVFIHGIWDNAQSWASFAPLIDDARFSISQVGYDEAIQIATSTPQYEANILGTARSNTLGFAFNAQNVLQQMEQFIRLFRFGQNAARIDVAAAQVDVIAHSMGGNVARTMPKLPAFLSPRSYRHGLIHKLITIDTPHLGTPLASRLLEDANACVRNLLAANGMFAFINVTIGDTRANGGVGDFVGDGLGGGLSKALTNIQSSPRQLLTALIGGEMGEVQLGGLDCFLGQHSGVCAAEGIRRTCNGNPLADNLTVQGWPTILGQQSDAIVPLNSQLNGLRGFRTVQAIHSAGTEGLDFEGPNVLENASGSVDAVITLLNTPANSPSGAFVCLPGGNNWPCQ